MPSPKGLTYFRRGRMFQSPSPKSTVGLLYFRRRRMLTALSPVLTTTTTAALTLPAPVVLAAARSFIAQGALTVPKPVIGEAAAEKFVATVGITVPAPLIAGASRSFEAQGALTLPAPTILVANFLLFQATIGLTLPAPVLAAQGSYATGAVSLSVPAPVIGSTAAEVFQATISVTLPPPVIGAAARSFIAQGALVVPAPVIGAAGTVTLPAQATGALTLPAPVIAGSGSVVNPTFAAAALTLLAPVIVARSSYETGTGALVLPKFVLGVHAVEHLGPPTISSVTPDIGGEITQVTIRGTNLTTVSDVFFGPYHYYGYPFTALITVVSDTEIQVLAPDPFYLSTDDLDNLLVDVSVVTPDGRATAVGAYTIVAPPVISYITPTLWFPGDPIPSLVIAGKNFQTSFSVQFGPYAIGASLTVTDDGTQLSVPLFLFTGFAAGVYPVRVWNDSGPSAVHNPPFTIAYYAQTPQAADLADALAGRYGPVVTGYVFEWHNRDNTFIADITTAVDEEDGCAIQLDNDQAIARTAQFHLLAMNLPAGFSATPASGKCIAVYAETVTPIATYRLQQGLFHTDEPQHDQFPTAYEEWQAKASDVLIVLSERTVTVTYTVTEGTSYYNAIRAICTQFGLRTSIGIGAVPPANLPADVSWDPKTSYLQICNDLAFGLNNYALFADETGLIQLVPRVDPELVPAGTTYDATGEPNLLVGDATTPSSRVVATAQYKNFVTVAIDDPARDPYTTTFTNADPSSPLSTVASGKQDALSINGSSTPSTKAIYDETTADAIAKFEVKDEALRAVQRVIHTFPDPRRTNHEWYRLKIPGFEHNSLWRVLKWDLPCTAGGDMQHTLGLAAPVAASAGAPVLTQIVQRIGAFGSAQAWNVAPYQLNADYLTFPVTHSTQPGSGIVVAFLTDTPPASTSPTNWVVSDTQGNQYWLVALIPQQSPFGTEAAPVNPTSAAFYHLAVYASIDGIALTAGADTITFNAGAFPLLAVAGGAWEVSGLSDTAADGAAAWNVGRDFVTAPYADTVNGPSSGSTDVSSGAGDLVVGLVAAVWDAAGITPGTVPSRGFTLDTGLAFDPANEVAVTTRVANGLYVQLWLELGIAQGAGSYSISGSFSQDCINWGALCVAIAGSVAG